MTRTPPSASRSSTPPSSGPTRPALRSAGAAPEATWRRGGADSPPGGRGGPRPAAVGGGPAPAFQLLFYPWLDLVNKRASYGLFGDGFYLTEADLEWYKQHYLGDEHDALDPRCSPLAAEDLAGAAPAYIVTAGFDPLRDEGEEYAERLRPAGGRA